MSYLLTSQDVQSSSESDTNALATSIDGNISTCFETNTETNPWWMIDLEREYTVFSIVLTTSQDQTGMKTNSFLLWSFLASLGCTLIWIHQCSHGIYCWYVKNPTSYGCNFDAKQGARWGASKPPIQQTNMHQLTMGFLNLLKSHLQISTPSLTKPVTDAKRARII